MKKKKKESIISGIIALLISQILIKIIGLAYKLYLTNKPEFGDAGNAIYSAGFQIYALLLTFSSTGVPNAISKLISERVAIGDYRGAHKIFKIAFFIFACFGIIGTIILFIGAKVIANRWLEIPEAEYSLITLSPSIFFVSIISVMRGYFNGRQKLSVTAKSQTIEQIFKTIVTIILVEIVTKFSKNYTVIAGAANLATTIATFFSFLYIFMYYNIRRKEIEQDIINSINYTPTRIRKTLKKILKESLPISLSSLISSFNKNIDLFTVVKLLKKFMSESQAKIQYGILSGKVDTLCLLPLSLNIPFVTGMVPEISKLAAKGQTEELNRKAVIFLRTTILIALPSAIGMIIFSNQILSLLFPNASKGAMLLRINSISIFFAMLGQTVNGILQGLGKNTIPLIGFSVGMTLKLILNYILIGNKLIGINGAAIGNIICNITVCIIGFINLKNLIKIKLKRDIFKIIISTFFMSCFSLMVFFLLKKYIFIKIATILAMLTGIAIYIGFLSILNVQKN